MTRASTFVIKAGQERRETGALLLVDRPVEIGDRRDRRSAPLRNALCDVDRAQKARAHLWCGNLPGGSGGGNSIARGAGVVARFVARHAAFRENLADYERVARLLRRRQRVIKERG